MPLSDIFQPSSSTKTGASIAPASSTEQTVVNQVPTSPVKEPGIFENVKSSIKGFLGIDNKSLPESKSVKEQSTPLPASTISDIFKPVKGSTPKTQPSPLESIFNLSKPDPYFYAKTDEKGGAIGRSNELDTSGRPLFAYRNPGDTATTTDKTRVATTFDPRVAKPLTKEEYYNPRSESLRKDFHNAFGIEPSEQLDHAIALTVGGSNNLQNLRAIPTKENQQAGNYEGKLAQLLKAGKISYFEAQVADAKNKGVNIPWTPQQKKDGLPHLFEDALNRVNNYITSQFPKDSTPPTSFLDMIGKSEISSHNPRNIPQDSITSPTTYSEGGPEGKGFTLYPEDTSQGKVVIRAPFSDKKIAFKAPFSTGGQNEQLKLPIINFIANIPTEILNAAGRAITTAGQEFSSLGKEKTTKLSGFEKSLNSGEGEYKNVNQDIKDRLANGDGVLSSYIGAISQKVLDITFGASVVATGLRAVSRILAKKDDISVIEALKTLGSPKNKTELDSNYRQLAQQFHPDITGGSDTPIKVINEAKKILEEKGLPTAFDLAKRKAAQYAEVLGRETALGQPILKQNIEINKDINPQGKLLPLKQLPGYARENPTTIKAGLSTEPVKPVGFAEKQPVYEGEKDLTITSLEKLKGRPLDQKLSKVFYSDLAKQGDLKQPERDVINGVLADYPESASIPVKEFAAKVKMELLPLSRNTSKDLEDPTGDQGETRYEHITLPSDIRGPVGNYYENVWESPIKTSAGDIHFGPDANNYFGHTRVEDMGDNSTRRVIEVQSDLYQKGNLDKEDAELPTNLNPEDIVFDPAVNEYKIEYGDTARYGTKKELTKLIDEADNRQFELKKLAQYTNPTAHFRMVREEIKSAAQDGKTKLQFPTGETAMKIERLGINNDWATSQLNHTLRVDELKIGQEISNDSGNTYWIITDVLGNGKFKAVHKEKLLDPQFNYSLKSYNPADWNVENGLKAMKESDHLQGFTETFDISGKVDTNNPIYKFYEKDLGKYLTSKYNAKVITDKQGVKWYEVDVNPEAAKKPVTAFRRPFFSNISGPKAPIEDIKKMIFEDISEKDVRLIFSDKLIDGDATGMYSRQMFPGLNPILKPMIQLYTENGYGGVLDAYHESGHYIFDNFLTAEEKKKALEMAHRQMKLTDKIGYRARGYKGSDNIAEEFIMDEYAKQRAKQAGYSGPFKQFFEQLDKILKKIYELYKKVVDRIKKTPNKEGGFARTPDFERGKSNRKGAPEEYDKSVPSPVEPITKSTEITQVEEKVSNQFKNPIEIRINELEQQIQFTKESIENDPVKSLAKYANKNGELPEVLGSGIGHGYFKTHGDDLVTELGFEDSETARAAFQNFRLHKKRLESLENELRKLKIAYKSTRILDKDAKAVSAFLEKSFYKEDVKIAENAKKLTEQPPESKIALARRKQAAQKNLQALIGSTYNMTTPLQRSTPLHMLKLTEQSYNMSLEEFEKMNAETSFENTVSKYQTPVNKKVGIIDTYLSTPDRVLKKIGLPNTMNLLRHSYENYRAELPTHIELIKNWAKRVLDNEKEILFDYLDGQDIRNYYSGKTQIRLSPETKKIADKEIKPYLAFFADRLGLPEDEKVSHYITHIFGLGENAIEKDFDEELAKIITDKVTGSVYDPFLQKRLGAKGYLKDPWKALDAYAKTGVRKANMDPVLERLQLESTRLELSQLKYIKRLTDRVNLRPTEIDTAIDNTIKTVIGYKFGSRPVAYLSRIARQAIFRYSLGLNFGSAIRNLTQGVNTYAKLGEKYTALGYMKLLTKASHKELEEQGILGQDIVQDKVLSSTKKWLERGDKALFFVFELAEKVNRGAAYYGAKAKGLAEGLDELKAIEYAKKIVRDTQFQFGSIDTPVGLNSDIAKVITQFMTYGVKQAEFGYEMLKQKEWPGVFRYIVASMAVLYLIGKEFNLKWSDFVPGFSFLKLGVPPALAFPLEVTKAALDVPDKFGNSRTLMQKVTDVADTIPFPAGVQAKKTYRGFKTYTAKEPAKKVEQNTYNLIKSLVLGSKNIEVRKDVVQTVYDNVQQLKNQNRNLEAQTIVDTLSAEDYSIYSKIRAADRTAATKELKIKVRPIYDRVQNLKSEGKQQEAQNIVDGLSDEEYKVYRAIKKLLNP